MPVVSEPQRRAMYAALSGKSTLGIPKAVAREFIGKDEWIIPIENAEMQKTIITKDSACVVFLDKTNNILFLKSSKSDIWGFPGGHILNTETLEECAIRETLEETGYEIKEELQKIYTDESGCTYYLVDIDEKFDVTISNESSGFCWSVASTPPTPLRCECNAALAIARANTEIDIAKLIAEAILPSPQEFGNSFLVDMRITGTGLAYRSGVGEHVWREPSLYLNDAFLQRCNGLPVILDHPDGSVLNEEEFNTRISGTVIYPYIKGDEVWGITRIFTKDALDVIINQISSTSPSVVFGAKSGNITSELENGEKILIEGIPLLVDHLAIVSENRGGHGVWDKGGDASGININNEDFMTEKVEHIEEKKDDSNPMEKILEKLDSLHKRMDAFEKEMPSDIPPENKLKKNDDDDDDEEEPIKVADKKRKDEEDKGMKFDSKHRKDDDDDEEEEESKKDDDDEEYADAQARADSVMSALGKKAPRPLSGESLVKYRSRLLKTILPYSEQWKDIDLKTISKDQSVFKKIESQVYADAASSAKMSMSGSSGSGQLHCRTSTDESGRVIRKYYGDPSVMLGGVKLPPMYFGFNKVSS